MPSPMGFTNNGGLQKGTYRVTTHLPHNGGIMVVTVVDYGIDEEDILRKIVDRYPDCTEVLPNTWTGAAPKAPPRTLICAANCSAQTPQAAFCPACGEVTDFHPVWSRTPAGDRAQRWKDQLEAELMTGGNAGWD